MVNIMNQVLSQLKSDKIKINWNKNPIKMKEFLEFLTVDVKLVSEHLGSDMGWTKYIGDNRLIISGGKVAKTEYLDSIQYKNNLSNPYNNYVNPFFIFDILTLEGQKFFFDYYKEDICTIIEKQKSKIEQTEKKLADLKTEYSENVEFFLDFLY